MSFADVGGCARALRPVERLSSASNRLRTYDDDLDGSFAVDRKICARGQK